MARAAAEVVRARNHLAAATVSGDQSGDLTAAIILLDRWLGSLGEGEKRRLSKYFGPELPSAAAPGGATDGD